MRGAAVKDKKFYVGAAVLAGGGFAAKAIGALYRIPLFNILGAEGMGVYQLIFPLYSLLLTFSSSAVPVAISRLVAECTERGNYKSAAHIFSVALSMFAVLGAAAGGILALAGRSVALWQGNPEAATGYLAIAPAVALVAVIAAFRGYFQGLQQMSPTALSQIVEQAVKLGLGLVLAVRYMPDVERAVGGAVLAVTVSEAAALVQLFITYLLRRRRIPRGGQVEGGYFVTAKRILSITFPVTVGALILPFSQIIDSLMVINLISRYSDAATGMYGLLTGAVFSLNSLPVAVAFSVAVSSVPLIAKTRAGGDGEGTKRRISASLTLTLLIAVPAACLILFLADGIAAALYGSLPPDQLRLLAGLFRAASAGVVFLSFTQTITSCLQGMGKIYVPVIHLAIGVAVKIALGFVLLPLPGVNIFGAVISTNACYLVAGILNLVYIIRRIGFKFRIVMGVLLPVGISLAAASAAFFVAHLLPFGAIWSLAGGGLAAAGVYAGLVSVFYGRRAKHEDNGSGAGSA